jgi:ribosomal protein S18 acetylase RimI-like enzyme
MAESAFAIEPFTEGDFETLVDFVAAIQEHERATVSTLKSGIEIGAGYARFLVETTAKQNGVLFFAKERRQTLGFISAWVAIDDDLLVQDQARHHGYVSDIFVVNSRRGKGIAQALLAAAEAALHAKGCRRMRICSKASNLPAIKFYESCGFRPYEIIFSKELSFSD